MKLFSECARKPLMIIQVGKVWGSVPRQPKWKPRWEPRKSVVEETNPILASIADAQEALVPSGDVPFISHTIGL